MWAGRLLIVGLLLLVRVAAGQRCDLPACQLIECTGPSTFFPTGQCPDSTASSALTSSLTCTATKTCKFRVGAPAATGRTFTCNEGATCQVNATLPMAISGKSLVTWSTAKTANGSYNLELNCLATDTCQGPGVMVSALTGTLAVRCFGNYSCVGIVLDCANAFICAVDCTSHPKACVNVTMICNEARSTISNSFACVQTLVPTTTVPTSTAPTFNPCFGWSSWTSDVFPFATYTARSEAEAIQCTCGGRIVLKTQCDEVRTGASLH